MAGLWRRRAAQQSGKKWKQIKEIAVHRTSTDSALHRELTIDGAHSFALQGSGPEQLLRRPWRD